MNNNSNQESPKERIKTLSKLASEHCSKFVASEYRKIEKETKIGDYEKGRQLSPEELDDICLMSDFSDGVNTYGTVPVINYLLDRGADDDDDDNKYIAFNRKIGCFKGITRYEGNKKNCCKKKRKKTNTLYTIKKKKV